MRYNLGALGGTFDILHQGHKEFLKFALSQAEKIVVGLTSDTYVVENKPGRNIASFDLRKNNLSTFFKEMHVFERVTLIPLDDMSGPTLDPNYLFDVLFVTTDSLKNGEEVNKKRKDVGLLPLPLEIFNLVKASDGSVISASKIRTETVLMPAALRVVLQKPFGNVLSELPQRLDFSRIVTVGDATTKRFLDAGIEPFLVIIDNKIERKETSVIEFINREVVYVRNSASTISSELIAAVKSSFDDNKKKAIQVSGEEDLAVLPVIENAPLGFTVYYGQPKVGLVEVPITDKMKSKVQDIILQFE